MEHQLLIGKFTLESLTSGLYVSPLDLYREYVQNAADSIDEALEQGILKKGEEKISITVSESERIIKISDNGTGVGANDIYSNLIDIGNSKKRHSNSRGFRGIGRLSGLGYCQKLKFLTSIHGEEKASCIIYDAEKLKYLLSPQVDSRDSIDQVLSSVLTIEEIPERINKHYFSVELYGVVPESDLLNDSEVVPYLQQNLPVPFSRDFVWGSMIKQKLVQMEVELAEYNVELRTDRTVIDICKPYKNKILADRIRKINDSISDINFVPFYSGEKVTAMLWYAETNFLGTVLDKDIKGIRIRQGNILIGDENTLRKCYKEERFNSWMVGELLVFNEDIIPNTRRDDYEKNSAYKELLSQFTEWANEMSRQIRHRSYERSLTQSDKKFLADESVTDVDGVDISLGTELDSYDMDDSDSVANTDLLSKLCLAFKFVDEFVLYGKLNSREIVETVTLYEEFEQKNAESENDPARQIQSWGSMDEKTVKVLMEEIILKMGEDKYSFATYLNILHNFVALVSIGFDEAFLNQLVEYMKNNIRNASERIELQGGYSFFINEDDKKLYALKSRELNVEIEEKNNSYQEKEMEKMLEDVNSWGINVNKYVTEHRKVVPKSFISKMDPGRILTLIEQSNTENIEAFRYAINDLYSFSNISDFYMEDYENLKTIYEGIKPDDQQYDLIKKKNVELLKVIIGRKMELLRPKSIDGN